MLQKRELKSNLCNNWCSLSANSARSDFSKVQIANTHCERLVKKNIYEDLSLGLLVHCFACLSVDVRLRGSTRETVVNTKMI